jgi:hypothetical protein
MMLIKLSPLLETRYANVFIYTNHPSQFRERYNLPQIERSSHHYGEVLA